MNTLGWLCVAIIIASWTAGAAFFFGPALMRHFFWRRWQRRHGGDITPLGKKRLGR